MSKLKKFILRFGIAFLIILALLTYFSDTIDNMLLPRVKTTMAEAGRINERIGTSDMKSHYLLPLSSVEVTYDTGTVYTVIKVENGDSIVQEITVDICDSNDWCCEVTSDLLSSDSYVVYETSKSIYQGCRVYVEEER